MDERAQHEIDQKMQLEAAYGRQTELFLKEARAQRRYEIARDVLASVVAMPEDQRPLYPEKYAVAWADALLAELEK